VWLIAFATGAISTWCYARIPEPPQQPHVVEAQRRTAERGLLRDILADRNFTLYLGSVLIWNLALQSAGPFFNVYLVKDLHASTFMVGVLSSLPAFTGLAGFVAFGRLMDRRGTKWVMTVNGLLIPLLPLMWVLVTAAWQVMFINAFGGMIWAGYNLALSNMVMIMAPPEKRARYAAAFQTVTFAGAFAGPLLGGYIIDAMGFQSVFILSAAGRAIGTIVLLRFVQSAHERSAPEGAAAAGEAEAAA
jgi:MFS family permease